MTEDTNTTAPAPATAATAIAAALIAIELSEPIQRGETPIATLQLRKPKAGELRGLSLQDVLTADISTILKLIPRISVPPLTQHEADELSPADLAEIGGAVRGFFHDVSGEAHPRSDGRGTTTDQLMADIAAIFHWPLSELRELDLVELTHWHELAIEWWKMELKLRARMSGMKG